MRHRGAEITRFHPEFHSVGAVTRAARVALLECSGDRLGEGLRRRGAAGGSQPMTAILCPSSLGCKSRHCLLNGIIVTPTVIPCQAQFHTKSGRNCRRLCMKRCTERLLNVGNACYTESGSTANDRKERTTMTIGDKCPYCGRELFSGYLQSARQIIRRRSPCPFARTRKATSW